MKKIVYRESTGDEDSHIQFAHEFVTDKWLSQQFKTLYEKNQFKEQSVMLGLVHPLIAAHLDIRRSIRKATILGEKKVLVGVGYERISGLGRSLYELNGLYDAAKVRARIQDASQFEDVCWELDVALVLKYSGFDIAFVPEGAQKSYDLIAKKNGCCIPIECKNKRVDHQAIHKINSICAAISQKVLKQMDKQVSRHNLRITLLNVCSLVEVKQIQTKVMELLGNGLRELQTEKFVVETVPEYEALPTSVIMRQFGCFLQEVFPRFCKTFSSPLRVGNFIRLAA